MYKDIRKKRANNRRYYHRHAKRIIKDVRAYAAKHKRQKLSYDKEYLRRDREKLHYRYITILLRRQGIKPTKYQITKRRKELRIWRAKQQLKIILIPATLTSL